LATVQAAWSATVRHKPKGADAVNSNDKKKCRFGNFLILMIKQK